MSNDGENGNMFKSTPQQQQVIETHKGVILTEACPGSGKTATLVQRTKALPAFDKKLILAFNKNAATVFQERLGNGHNSDVRTFHSFCLREIFKAPKSFGFSFKPDILSEAPLFRLLLTANDEPWQSWDESPWDEDFIRAAEYSYYDADLEYFATLPATSKNFMNTL